MSEYKFFDEDLDETNESAATYVSIDAWNDLVEKYEKQQELIDMVTDTVGDLWSKLP